MEKISDTMGVNVYGAYVEKQDDAADITLSERVKKAQEDQDDRNIKQREKEKNLKNLEGLMLGAIRLEAELLPDADTAMVLKQSDGKLSKDFLYKEKSGTLNKFELSLPLPQALPNDLANLMAETKQANTSADLLSTLSQPNVSSTDVSKKIIEQATTDDASAKNSLLQPGSLTQPLSNQGKINAWSDTAQNTSASLANVLRQTRLFSAMQSQAVMNLDSGAEANNLIYRFGKWGATHSVSVSSIDSRGVTDVPATVVLRPSDDLVGQRLTTHLATHEHGVTPFLVKDYRDQSSDRQPSQQSESSDESE